jgi:hypothetical protein
MKTSQYLVAELALKAQRDGESLRDVAERLECTPGDRDELFVSLAGTAAALARRDMAELISAVESSGLPYEISGSRDQGMVWITINNPRDIRNHGDTFGLMSPVIGRIALDLGVDGRVLSFRYAFWAMPPDGRSGMRDSRKGSNMKVLRERLIEWCRPPVDEDYANAFNDAQSANLLRERATARGELAHFLRASSALPDIMEWLSREYDKPVGLTSVSVPNPICEIVEQYRDLKARADEADRRYKEFSGGVLT